LLLSVGFETIYPESKRDEVMEHILTFYESGLDIFNSDIQPKKLTIHTLYPNPTNTSFTLDFSTIESEQFVNIIITNVLGQIIREERIQLNASLRHQWTWNGLDQKGISAPTGLYIVSLQNQDQFISTKVTLLK